MKLGRCLWCNKPLPKYRRKYCSDDCSYEYFIHHIAPLWWINATKIALERADYRCEQCGSAENLEVHHIIKLEKYETRHNNIKNSQDNLKVLCKRCHTLAHRSGTHTQQGKQLALF